ncbi:methanobactin biosynthesis cassette protein MbnB [Methylosinus sporium]|uniref:Methanobactin biosynthesis cassette protein MbnB n=1 Tax=Methylosinus sporium TaxID=428 RepID=A0A549SDX6_METSR|nr:methanobactin biosynthesis cassette protein MbnB [Methylosinus sp. KRF6]TRL26659.1 methanobactin biosynthesis cassette protein MbnB [Methylosinus sporium]
MQIGFNFTTNPTLDMVQRMIRERQIDYCELLIDNFLHVPPRELESVFKCPLAFHIMFSRFLESDVEFLSKFAKRLRELIDALNPLYVSDHVLRFTHEGRRLYHLGEIDYETEYELVKQRVSQWQDLVGRRLYLENYPSLMEGGWEAPAFFERLTKETGAGVLFDASNAVCAKRNCGAPVERWSNVIESTEHYHVAGYGPSFSAPHVTVDAHDREMAPDTIEFLTSMRSSFDKPGATMTYERDYNIEYDSISVDLQRLREIFSNTPEPDHASLVTCAS